MKKSGFTLSELLITLTVIGVVSALVLPAVSGILPDKNKAKVIKYNAMLNNAISDILTDDSVYRPYTHYDSTNNKTFLTINGEDECSGLGCISGGFEAEIKKRFINKINDGSSWKFEDKKDGTYYLEVVTDGKQSISFTGIKNATNKNINTFYFDIDQYGNVKPGDALTEAFLKNYKVLNDRKADLQAAKSFWGIAKYYKDTKKVGTPTIIEK